MSARKRGKVHIPFSRAPRGTCRWCGLAVRAKDGTQDTRRRWHKGEGSCFEEFARLQGYVWDPRGAVLERDHGVCGACGLDTVRVWKEAVRMSCGRPHLAATAMVAAGFERAHGHDPNQVVAWHVDHVVALWMGGKDGLDQVWTLCVPCHKAKTAEEAKLRAKFMEAFRASPEYAAGGSRKQRAQALEAFRGRYYPPPELEDAREHWRRWLCRPSC